MRFRAIILYTFFSLFFQSILAQQNNNWYFGGRAALNFNAIAGQPVPTALPNSQMLADEGSAAISDKNGDLLFYTNGVDIYNKQHQVMLNGNNIGGNISACQSSIIVPVPGNDSIYYVFTADAIENSFATGYCYSIVNIKRNNGNGEVIVKRSLLWASCTERLTAARHRNGTDVWLITNDNNSNVFRSWLISCNGLTTSPVVSAAGLVMNQSILTNTGFMKVSPDGRQLCQVHFPLIDPPEVYPNFIQLFDFDNSSGIISNARTFNPGNALYTNCEYSPNSQLLYLLRPFENKIDQIESRLPTIAAITASRDSILSTTSFYGIQLAPDEKIYLIRQGGLMSSINNPDIKGAGCNFRLNNIDIAPGAGQLGSPNFINDAAIDPNNGFIYNILDSCAGIVRFNAFSTLSGVLSWSWDFGDGNTSNQQNPVHTFNPSNQAYSVKLRISSSTGCEEIVRSRIVKADTTNMELFFDHLRVCDSEYVRFTNNNPVRPGDLFTWNFGDGNFSTDIHPVHVYSQPGNYPVTLTLTSANACRSSSVTDTITLGSFTINIPTDQTIFAGQSVHLVTSGPAVSYQWSPPIGLNDPNSPSPVATPLSDIIYKVVATDSAGCKTDGFVKITIIDPTDIYVPTGFTPNSDGKNDMLKPFYPLTTQLKEFSIYNRWGEKVYSTSNRGEGWNGKINGKEQQTSLYVWIFNATDDTGRSILRKGTALLIR